MDDSLHEEVEALARHAARQEIASLAGLIMRRLQDVGPRPIRAADLASIFGEALSDFSGHTKGDQPGE